LRIKQIDHVLDEIETIPPTWMHCWHRFLIQVHHDEASVGFGMAVMTTLLALVVLWQFRIVVVYVLISLTLAAVLRPFVNRLAGRGLVVRLAWILLYLVALGSFGFLLFQTGKAAINEIQQFAQTVSVQDAWRLPVWLEASSFQQALSRGCHRRASSSKQ